MHASLAVPCVILPFGSHQCVVRIHKRSLAISTLGILRDRIKSGWRCERHPHLLVGHGLLLFKEPTSLHLSLGFEEKMSRVRFPSDLKHKKLVAKKIDNKRNNRCEQFADVEGDVGRKPRGGRQICCKENDNAAVD